MLANAQNRSKTITEVKTQIYDRVTVIHENFAQVKTLVKNNINKKENPTGVLVQAEAEYLECLEF